LSDHVIERETGTTRGRLFIRKAGGEAELTWAVASPTRVIADHTGVPDAMRGTGAGQALVAQLVEDARKGGFRIVPLCPFVEVMRKRHPDWADAFTT
jgi:hypothetical protein